MTLSYPPLPSDPATLARVNHTRKRRRLLYSQPEQDLRELLGKDISAVREDAWGEPDTTANTYLSLWSQVATMYNVEPDNYADDADDLLEAVAEAGHWAQMQRVQRDTLALREMFVRADIDEEWGDLSYRPVFPDLVEAESAPRRPSIPVRIREHVEQPDGTWLTHDLSVRDPKNPFYRVYTADKRDVTGDVLGATYEGNDYRYRDSTGAPYLPYATYHAAETGFLFDPYAYREVVDGSLKLGVYLTYFGHILRNAAWAQRYTIGAEPIGMDVVTDDGIVVSREIATDPASLLMLRPTGDGVTATAGQFQSPVDIQAIFSAISMYERRLLLLAGLTPPDVTRQTADIRSGFSLAVSRDAVREAQRVYEPAFRRADQTLLRISACLSNDVKGTTYPEDPRAYRIAYRGVPLSPQEQEARRAELIALIEAGLLDRVSAYQQLHEGLTREEAEKALNDIRTTNARFA